MNSLDRSCNSIVYTLSLLLLLALPRPGVAATILPPFEIDYEISNSGIVGVEMKRRLIQLDNGEYRFESMSHTTKPLSWFVKDHISEISRWQFHEQRLRPLHYHYLRQGNKVKKHSELEFDWQQGMVSDRQRRPVWSHEIQPHTSDKLLYQLQLMMDLQAGKENFSYIVADSGKIRRYKFTRIGTETIDLPLGRYETVKLHRDTGKRTTTIWCAPALNYMPVRIDLKEKDGSLVRADATRVKGLPFVSKAETRKQVQP